MKRIYPIQLLIICCGLLGLWSCEDVIDVALDEGETLLVVDGWVTDQPGPYTIRLTTTAPYFSNQSTPRVSEASVRITDSEGFSEVLQENEPGIYQTSQLRGKIGNTYTLHIAVEGEEYEAQTSIRRVPLIDSLGFEYEEESPFIEEEGYYVSYFGPEPAGKGDFYRFKVYQNNQMLADPGDLIFVDDELVDGNYIHDFMLNDEAFQEGDTIRVENWSITEDAYYFYLELLPQIENFGLFANPPANVRTNVVNKNPEGLKAVGWFGGAGVSAKEAIIVPGNL